MVAAVARFVGMCGWQLRLACCRKGRFSVDLLQLCFATAHDLFCCRYHTSHTLRFPLHTSSLFRSLPFTMLPSSSSPLPPPRQFAVRTVNKAQVHWSNRCLLGRIAPFEVLECGGGGNCFFLSVSEVLSRHNRHFSAAMIRDSVADFIRDTSTADCPVLAQLEQQLALIGEESNPLVRSLPAYAEHIRRAGEHASAKFELPFVAALFNVRVRLVYQTQGKESSFGVEMRDCWVDPPSGMHAEVPIQVHLLLLNGVSSTQTTNAAAATACSRACAATACVDLHILCCNVCCCLHLAGIPLAGFGAPDPRGEFSRADPASSPVQPLCRARAQRSALQTSAAGFGSIHGKSQKAVG